jgi:hypothetical protein
MSEKRKYMVAVGVEKLMSEKVYDGESRASIHFRSEPDKSSSIPTSTMYSILIDVVFLDKPVDVQFNKCGDPVTSEVICEQLQHEICICNDSALAQLCGNYCSNKCIGYPFHGSNCLPAISCIL